MKVISKEMISKKMISKILGMLALAGIAMPALAQDSSYSLLDPNAYQSFVANWTPADKPLCAAIQSQDDWDSVFHPAPVMGADKPFAPPSDFWRDHAVLVLAKVMDAGDTTNVFPVTNVHRDEKLIEIKYSYRLTPPASSKIKYWLGVSVAKPLPPAVRFTEDGRVVCTLAPVTPDWIRPKPVQ
jgi:hypothetical protein